MVNEVNKIVYNLILSGNEVCIEGVGTLFTERYAAYRTSKKSLMPPYRVVRFTTEQRGSSLEEEIARVADIDSEKAHEVFERWLAQSRNGDTLTIGGVGVLRNDKFTADEALLAALNPQGRAPIRLKPKRSVGLYIFASLCILFALAVAGYVYIDNNDIALLGGDDTVTERMAQNTTPEPLSQNDTTAEVVVDSVNVEAPATETTPQPAPQPQTTFVAESSEILSTSPGTSYLVLGVFSTTENAERAIREAKKRADNLQYLVYHYGSKYMVTLYDAQSRGECRAFADSLGETFKDLWIYSRK